MDLANQASVMQKVNGWKIFHLNAQMEDLVSVVVSWGVPLVYYNGSLIQSSFRRRLKRKSTETWRRC